MDKTQQQIQDQLDVLQQRLDELTQSSQIPRDVETAFRERLGLSSSSTEGFAIGDIKVTANSTPPLGWLLCDGSAILRTGIYAPLFAAIGTNFGIGDGSTTFNVPDTRGRAIVGLGSGSFLTIGSATGEETHTLSTNEMPTHHHTLTLPGSPGVGISYGGTATATVTNTSDVGGGAAHNNIQPSLSFQVIIKYA